MIYKMPLIGLVRLLNRAKIYQTALTGVFASMSIYSYMVTDGHLKTVLILTAVCALASGMLYVFGHSVKRLVGIVYVNPDRSRVKIAHLTFWGRRQDEVVDANDLYALSDFYDRKAFLVKLERVSTVSDYYYFTFKFGGVTDKQTFEQVFRVTL